MHCTHSDKRTWWCFSVVVSLLPCVRISQFFFFVPSFSLHYWSSRIVGIATMPIIVGKYAKNCVWVRAHPNARTSHHVRCGRRDIRHATEKENEQREKLLPSGLAGCTQHRCLRSCRVRTNRRHAFDKWEASLTGGRSQSSAIYFIRVAYLFDCDYVMLTNNGHFITMQCVKCDCVYPISLAVVLRRQRNHHGRCWGWRCRRHCVHSRACMQSGSSHITSTGKYLLAISNWEWW